MSRAELSHVAAELFVDYFAGELDAPAASELEDHVFECAECAAHFERAGALANALGALIPPVISRDKLERLEKAGRVVKRVAVDPGTRIDAVFEKRIALLVFAFRGKFGADERIDLELCAEEGTRLVELTGVPVDRDQGELLVACQRHYAEDFPAVIRFRAWGVRGDDRRAVGEYVVNHIVE